VQEADAADVAQEVMRTVARSMERFEYDPQRGQFRKRLLTVTRSKLNDFFARRQRQPDPASATSLQQLADAACRRRTVGRLRPVFAATSLPSRGPAAARCA
jgi:RNA polymerase sigma-70 factor (ECF subfamily)